MSEFEEYAKYYRLIYKDKPYKEESDFVYKWAKKPKRILELGCGLGLHAQHLCEKAKVIGIDCSKEMLSQAYQHPNIKYFNLNIDYSLFKIKEEVDEVDCVLALFNVMGYVILEDCFPYLPLKRGGYFIFDTWDASKMRISPPKIRVQDFGEVYRISIPEQVTKRLLRIRYILSSMDWACSENHLVQGYFRKDIKDICKLNNYEIVDTKPTKTWKIWYKLRKL